jgi:ribonuclease-3
VVAASEGLRALARAVGLDEADATLTIAVTHSSYAAEHRIDSNERLEFLGDAVVGLLIAEHAFCELDLAEGGLAQVRQATVAEPSLAAAARDLGIDRALRLGRGEEGSGGRQKDSVLSDAYEAVIAAVYLDGGIDAARRVVLGSLEARFRTEAADPGASDLKSRLQEWAESNGLGTPVYEVAGTGPAHAQRFVATVLIGGTAAGSGEGSSKKAAELVAAHAAWEGRDA